MNNHRLDRSAGRFPKRPTRDPGRVGSLQIMTNVLSEANITQRNLGSGRDACNSSRSRCFIKFRQMIRS